MLCVRDRETCEAARRSRWFGIDRERRKASLLGEPEWDVSEVGYKFHMNDIAASLGVEHLAVFPAIASRRAHIAGTYAEALHDLDGISLFERSHDRTSANWTFNIHVSERRDDFARMMHSKGVQASVVHLRIDRNSVFGGMREDLPQLEKLNRTMMSLPLHNQLSDDDVAYVIECVKGGW